MKKILFLIPVIAVILFAGFLTTRDLQLLNPHGAIALTQRRIIITAVLLMLIIVIPVLAALVYVAVNYREKKKNKYTPDKTYSFKSQITWWLGPTVIIFIIAGLIWHYTHVLDPFKPLPGSNPPERIQVVALNWKWLFIYPDERIATVNYVMFPEKKPVRFELTSDGPMNSFWIPNLAGQMYAMSGMVTTLNLVANTTGTYGGKAVEINGNGYAGMTFEAKAVTQKDFDEWVLGVKKSGRVLDEKEYNKLEKPSENVAPMFYSLGDTALYDKIIKKYLPPPSVKREGY